MKINTLLACFFAAFVLVSCKKEETLPDSQDTSGPVFSVTLNASVLKDDTFQLFFKEDTDPATPFDEASSIYVDVKGNNSPQDVVFKLPEGVNPVAFRLDFGLNKSQDVIKINTFKASYGDKKFGFGGDEFFRYFRADTSFAKVDKAAGTITPFVTKDGNFDPMVFSEEQMTIELQKLFQ